MPDRAATVTRLLRRSAAGDRAALDELLPLVYDELHALARRHIAREAEGHTLQPTALVNEAYLRLVDQRKAGWRSRSHFLGLAARAMRRILVDHARRRRAAKRGGGAHRISLDEAVELEPREWPAPGVDLIALDAALEGLARLDERQGRIVELRFFGGLSVRETAGVLGISPATVKRDWSMARAWLYRELRPESGGGSPAGPA